MGQLGFTVLILLMMLVIFFVTRSFNCVCFSANYLLECPPAKCIERISVLYSSMLYTNVMCSLKAATVNFLSNTLFVNAYTRTTHFYAHNNMNYKLSF